MDYRFPSINNQNLFQEKDPPLFFEFPSPFLDDMDDHLTTTILPNLHRDSTETSKTTTTNNHLKLINTTTHKPSASRQIIKRIRKKRTAGKNDRHSKIHTAQGLRDRRMRLSVHTARKFFDLNDMLGFDKASKTIEWLFSKSQNAIKEVEETLQSDDANEIAADEDKGDQIKNVTKSKELFQEDSSVDFQLSQLGLFDTTAATITSANYNSIFDYNKTIAEPPVGWLNSRNTFLGFLEGWDSQSSRLMESNKGFVANIASWSGTKREINASAGIVSSSFIKFQSGNQEQ